MPIATDQADVGLGQVDHIAQSMPQEEFLSWQLYYTSLLDARRTAPSTSPIRSGWCRA